MNKESIEKRLLEIKKEHDELVDRAKEYNDALQQITARRLQLEGAFKELQDLMSDDAEDKTEDAE